ncbi:lysostaphin resistance A-like protein [Chloroflexota bacterium]
MSTTYNGINTNYEATKPDIPQYRLPIILFMYAWPIAWFMFLIYVIGPTFVRADGTFPLWGLNLIGLLGNGAELTVALIIFRREGYRLTLKSLRERINWRLPDKLWKWGACVAAFVAAVGCVLLLLPLETQLATTFPPPVWMPDTPVNATSSLPVNPDPNLVGTVVSWIYQVVIVSWIMNFIGEELYYRAALQPKLRGVFGKWAWVASGVGFGLKHLYFWWRVPYLIPAGLAFGFIYGPMGSLPLSIFFHWLGNTI